MLNLLHLNGYDVHGGAERICSQLITRQKLAGNSASLLVGRRSGLQSESVPILRQPKLEIHAAPDFPDYDIAGSFDLLRHPLVGGADVLHLHNAYGGWLNPWVLPALSHFRPLVWTLHDMQPLSGYCSHSLGCERWATGCGQCPDLTLPGPSLKTDITAELWRDKALISSLSRFNLVACCEWGRANVDRSLLGQHPVEVIPNGVDTAVFAPRDRSEARRRLGVPDDVLVLGGVASVGTLSHPWKGGSYLVGALKILAEQGVKPLLLNVGSQSTSEIPGVIDIPFVDGPVQLSWIYAAMDVFVFPSIAENMPLSTLEAMACGLPVIASNVGGIPEQISNGVNGILVPARDSLELANAISLLLRDNELRKRLGESARERVVREFDFGICASRYQSIYDRLVLDAEKKAMPRDLLEQVIATERKAFELQLRVKDLQTKRKADRAQSNEQTAFLRQQNWLRALVRLRLAPKAFRRWWNRHIRDPKND